MVSVRKFKEMKDVLMDANVKAPSLSPYYVIKNPGQNFTILPPIMYGSEFNKTYGHYHVPDYPEKYKLLTGDGYVLVQRLINRNGPFDKLKEIYIQKLKKDEWVELPPDSAHILVNVGNDLMITQDDQSDANFDHDYKSIENLKGMGYYVVKGSDGGLFYVKNPNYSNLPSIQVKD